MSFRKSLVELYGFKIAFYRLGKMPSAVVGNSEKIIESRFVHPQLCRFSQMLCRFGIVLLLIVEQPQVALQRREIPLNRDCFLVIGDGGLLVGFGFNEA